MTRLAAILCALALGCGGDDDGGGSPDAGGDPGEDAATPDGGAEAVKHPYACTIEVDFQNDGEVDELWTTTQDGMVRTTLVDTGLDEELEYRQVLHLDADGNPDEYFQYDGDDVALRHEIFTYDGDGHNTRWELDTPVGAPIEYTYDYTWDGGLRTRTDLDESSDDVIDLIYRYFYDDDDHLVRQDFDTDAADEDAEERVTYENDAGGHVVRYEYDADLDEQPETIITYDNDADGNVLHQENDNDADGNADSITDNTYDAAGNQLTYELDNDADGEVDYSTLRTYGCFD